MRMDPTRGETALQLIERTDADDLARILRDYGEERYARKIARAVKDAVRAGALRTTTELRAVVVRAVPRASHERIDPATRTFQALRIAVNRELEELDRFLQVFPISSPRRGDAWSSRFTPSRTVPSRSGFASSSGPRASPWTWRRRRGSGRAPSAAFLTKKPVVPSERRSGATRGPARRSSAPVEKV